MCLAFILKNQGSHNDCGARYFRILTLIVIVIVIGIEDHVSFAILIILILVLKLDSDTDFTVSAKTEVFCQIEFKLRHGVQAKMSRPGKHPRVHRVVRASPCRCLALGHPVRDELAESLEACKLFARYRSHEGRNLFLALGVCDAVVF